MAIKYYPNRVFRALPTPVDALTKKDIIKSFSGVQDITATALDVTVNPSRDWQVTAIQLIFSGATARDYSIKVVNGRSVVNNLNDFLWLQTQRTLPQKITLDVGFYTGTELATQLQTKLDANDAFSDLGVTFTVTYAAVTGKYTITPSSGTVQYLDMNPAGRLPDRYSICGHLFGFNEDTSVAASITSDTSVPGLDSESFIVDETADTDLSRYLNDQIDLSMDEAIRLETSVAALTVNYFVKYKELDR